MNISRILTLTVICLLAGALFTQPAAAVGRNGLGVGVGISTLGAGADIIGRINDNLNLRLGLHGFTYNIDGSYDGVEYDADLELFTGMLLADWFPFTNNFRVSAGLMYNGNEVSLSSSAKHTYFTIGDHTYKAKDVGTLSGSGDFNPIAPYLGFGYGGTFGDLNNFTFSFDIGILYQGSVDISSYTATGPLATNAQFQADMETERQQLEDDLDDYQFYPVVSFGVAYKF